MMDINMAKIISVPTRWRFMCVTEDNSAIGEVTLRMDRNKASMSIWELFVEEPYRRHGVASRLMRRVLTAVDTNGLPVYLNVHADNAPAIALYEKFGFVSGKAYVKNGIEHWVMNRPALPRKG